MSEVKIGVVSGGRNSLLTATQLNEAYQQGRADAIDEYKEQLLENLIPLKDKYFDLAKRTKMPKRYTHLKRMDTTDMIIEMVKIKAEQVKEQKNGKVTTRNIRYDF